MVEGTTCSAAPKSTRNPEPEGVKMAERAAGESAGKGESCGGGCPPPLRGLA